MKNNASHSFETLLATWERPIFNYAYRLLGRREDAEDIVQETFLRLWRHRRRLDPDRNIKAFIYKIATNAAYDMLRARKRGAELFIIDDPDTPFETIDPADAYSSLGAAGDTAVALDKIPAIYRSVLLLFYKEDLTYEEIAAVLALPINTVKTRIRRAKEALRIHLTNYAP